MVETRMLAAAARLLFPPLLCWFLLLLLLTTAFVSSSFDFVVRPEFGEKPSDLNVTVFAGQISRLPCTVKHLSGTRVSWIRGRDLQVLSTGRVTFSTDLRISVLPGTTKFRVPRHVRTCQACGPPLPNGEPQGVPDDGDWPIRSREYSFVSPISRESSFLRPIRSRDPSFVSPISRESSFLRPIRNRDPSLVSPIRNREYSPVSPIRSRESFLKPWKKKEEVEEEETSNGASQVVTNDLSSEQLLVNTNAPGQFTLGSYSLKEAPPPSRHRDGTRRGQHRSEFAVQNENYHRAKKSLDALSKTSQSGGASYSGRYYTEREQDTPIAIYPQGRASSTLEQKGLQAGPNYIEGVWEPEDYTLQIKFTRPEDAGTYMCQINTEPKISQVIRLSVVKMRAEIVGRRELFVKAGTPVTLACRVNQGPLMPGFILWYKGERLVEYDRSGGRIQVVTGAEGVSHLILQDATPSDSANYTCSPSGGEPASLILNVIVDERQAAMQQGNSAPSSPLPAAAVLTMLLLCCIASNDSLAVGGTLCLLWAGSHQTHSCTTAAVLVTVVVVVLSLVPLTLALSRERRDLGASLEVALCHTRSVQLVLGATLCAIVFLLCN